MSRSYKKHPYTSWTANFKSNELDRKMNHRMMRRAARMMLHAADDIEEVILPQKLDEFMDRWDYADDGRVYSNSVEGRRWGVTSPEFFRK